MIFILICGSNFSQTFYSDYPLASTYSIVGRDEATGEIGVAVQSHWFSVGTIVSWGEASAGVIATQSFVNASFGPHGLNLLKEGFTAQQVLDSLINSDEGREFRQLAVLDTRGNAAAFTGKNCIEERCQIVGRNYSVQANMMLNGNVCNAMAESFRISTGPLAERLLAALEAAETAGGDIRGKQSAALLVFKGEASGKVWEDKLVDIRIDDNREPLVELKRILKVHRAYEHMNRGDLAIEHGNMETALKEYSSAGEMYPDNEEMKFWHAVTLANNGMVEKSLNIFKDVFGMNNNWKILLKRLPASGLLNVSDNELKLILGIN